MITLISVPGTGGALMFEDDPGPPLTDPWLDARGQCYGVPNGRNWQWFSITYPAAVFPMGPSWRQGVEIVVWVLLNDFPTGFFVLDGYSQGAIVTSHVWRDEILNPNGRLAHRLNDCLGVIEYGPPCRAPGVAYGNTLLWGHPVPGPQDGVTTGGIAGPDDLTPAQCLFPTEPRDGVVHPLAGKPAVYCHANDTDLYGACPVGDNPWAANWQQLAPVGYDEHLVYSIVQDFNVQNIEAMALEAFTTLGVAVTGFDLGTLIQVVTGVIGGVSGTTIGIPGIPASGASTPSHVAAILLALLHGGMFVFTGFSGHGAYDSGPAIAYLDQLGREFAA